MIIKEDILRINKEIFDIILRKKKYIKVGILIIFLLAFNSCSLFDMRQLIARCADLAHTCKLQAPFVE